MRGGQRLYDQIDRAVQVHDRLLLVISESSMAGERDSSPARGNVINSFHANSLRRQT